MSTRPLTVTGNQLLVTCSAEGEPFLSRAILSILQYDKDPVGDAKRSNAHEAQEGDNENRCSLNCLLGRCLEYQILSSVGIWVDDGNLEKQIREGGQWLPWEVTHATLVLRFCRLLQQQQQQRERCEDSLVNVLRDCQAALLVEPADVFTARLAMIVAFLSGDYRGLRNAMWAALRSAIFDESPVESTTPIDEGVAYWMPPPVNKVKLAASNNLCLPYLMSFFAFALEEIGFTYKMCDTRSVGEHIENEQATALIASAKTINDAAISFVEERNQQQRSPNNELLTHVFAVHVVCHLFEAQCDPQAGIAAVLAIDPALWQSTAHLVVHCWWHVALFQFDCGLIHQALDTFQQYVLPHVSQYDPFSLSDATAFLARCALILCVKTSVATADFHNNNNKTSEEETAVEDEKRLTVDWDKVQEDVQRLSRQVEQLWTYWRSEEARTAFVQRLPFFHLHFDMHAALGASALRLGSEGGGAKGGVEEDEPPLSLSLIPPARLLAQLLRFLEGLQNPLPTTDSDSGSSSKALLWEALQATWQHEFHGGRGTWWSTIGGSGAQRELLFRLSAVAWTKGIEFGQEGDLDETLAAGLRRDVALRSSTYGLWMYQQLSQ